MNYAFYVPFSHYVFFFLVFFWVKILQYQDIPFLNSVFSIKDKQDEMTFGETESFIYRQSCNPNLKTFNIRGTKDFFFWNFRDYGFLNSQFPKICQLLVHLRPHKYKKGKAITQVKMQYSYVKRKAYTYDAAFSGSTIFFNGLNELGKGLRLQNPLFTDQVVICYGYYQYLTHFKQLSSPF